MRLQFAFLLFALLCTPVLAAVPSCVLKVRIISPSDGYFAPAVADGVNNLYISANVTNASSNSPVAGATANLCLDNGTVLGVTDYGNGNFSISIADYREGTHTYTVNASRTGCINDAATQYYYYRKSVVRSTPDFNPLLAPLVAFALLLVARQKNKRVKK